MNADVHLRIECRLPQRLIMQALQAGAQLSRVRIAPDRSLHIRTDEKSAAAIKELCRRYGLNMRIVRTVGLSALRQLIRRRITLIPAVLLCMLLCVPVLTHLWFIEIRFTGPCAHLGKEAPVRAFLEESGVRPGMPAGKIDAPLLEAQLLSRAGDFSYAGVRLRGVHLLVELAPEVPVPETHEINRPRDLVAARDGVVKDIRVYAGTACVKPGDTVRRGQVLIRGEETIGADAQSGEEIRRSVRALGEVNARCWLEGSAQAPLRYESLRPTGRSSRSARLVLGSLGLPLQRGENYEHEILEKRVTPVTGLYLPLALERTLHIETAPVSTQRSREEAESALTALARADALRAANLHSGYETASHWTDAQQDENTLRIRAVYEIYTNIAVTRDALIEEETELGKLRT